MQGGLFSYALLAALASGLLYAAYTDLKRRQIENWLNAAIAIGAPIFWLASGASWTDVGMHLALAVAVFLVLLVLFAMRQMGGGDLKLLVALALWISPLLYIKLIVMMALVGGAASIAGAAFNMERREGESLRDLFGKLAAAVWVIFSAFVVYGLMAGQPPFSQGVFDALATWLPGAWLFWSVLLIAAVALLFGIFHIVRRQHSRLPIPYGVAISIAGLWVLADTYIPEMIA